MADNPSSTPTTVGTVKLPGAAQIPFVVVKLPDGTLALRHPSELIKPGQTVVDLKKAIPGGG